MSNERDELRDFIQSNLHRIDGFERWTFQAPVDLADALIADGYRRPRQVTTVEELDALPWCSVIMSDEGTVFQKFTMWHEAGSRDLRYTNAVPLPAAVLHEGATE